MYIYEQGKFYDDETNVSRGGALWCSGWVFGLLFIHISVTDMR